MPAPRDKPEPIAALVDVVRSAQRMIVARIDLATLQAKDGLQAAALFAAAAVTALFGWVLLMIGAVTLLDDVLPTPAAFAIVGGVHLLAAFVVALFGKRRAEPGHSTLSPEE